MVDVNTHSDNEVHNTNGESDHLADKNDEVSLPGRGDSAWFYFILLLFLGIWGGHKFYLGKTRWGVFYFFSLGGFLLGVVIDIIIFVFGEVKDKDNRTLERSSGLKVFTILCFICFAVLSSLFLLILLSVGVGVFYVISSGLFDEKFEMLVKLLDLLMV